jgi:hypothetical protein
LPALHLLCIALHATLLLLCLLFMTLRIPLLLVLVLAQ